MSDPSAKTPATASGTATTGATAAPATSSKPGSQAVSPAADAPSPESQTSQTSNPHILPASHWAQLPPVNVREDDDSAFEDAASSTASLTASILEYRTVHGRTYHSERGNALSWGPNDAIHDESMDIFHHIATIMLDGKILAAPLSDDVQKVLDVGCGTGIWAIDFADQYPNAEVIGVDVSPQQPQWIPPNLRFEVDDVTQPWTYEPDSFDYIHIRWLVGAIPDWYALFREAYQALKPGGYLESQESSCMITSDDGTVKDGSPLDQWSKVFSEAGKKTGRTFNVIEDDLQRKAMEAAGFEITYETDIKTALSGWPRDEKLRQIGLYTGLAVGQDIEGFLTFLWTMVMGWTPAEIQVYAAHLRRDMRSPNIHAYYPTRIMVGRKPLTAGTAS
ncbi:S-adenosyl-L-methionine-dependent methyltransferase [Daldinia loculata]|uniref:S-adenosyl-L-methionine-dependent methyltransferase n=1 Tax=Daldinia loculata TaxID=103429 RepID=UPI0020C5A36A|nr:S-adenosyl-L-methionine-dependent methyltransferase [Daldinia loculata]KAI1647030.1 S-adenosyl-L-methionine-dependent methyltransferase [Daldinia loculata]